MSFTFGASAGQKPAFGFGSAAPSFGAPAATTATTGFGATPAPSFGFGAPATSSAAPAFGFGAPAATAGTLSDFCIYFINDLISLRLYSHTILK